MCLCMTTNYMLLVSFVFFSSRRRHTRCALVTGVQTCALPIYRADDEVGLGDAFGEVRAVRKARLGARFEEGADAFEHFGIAVEDRDVGAEPRRHLRRVEADYAAADDADLARRDAGDAAQERTAAAMRLFKRGRSEEHTSELQSLL